MVFTLVDKLSDKSFHNENLIKIKSFLLSNSYRHDFIEFCIKKRLDSLHQSEMNFNDVANMNLNDINNNKMNLCVVQNKNNLLYRIKRAFKPYNVYVIPNPNYMFNNLIIRGKDHLNKFQKTHKV